MISSDIELHGAYRDLQKFTLTQMLQRERPEEHGFVLDPETGEIVSSALSERSTKLQRYKALELALTNYDGQLASPLDQLLPRLLTEDSALTIDVVLDVWMRHPIFVAPFLLSHLQITHHPERLRQMLGAIANTVHEEINSYWGDDENPFNVSHPETKRGRAELQRGRAESRREIGSMYASLAVTLVRFQAMQYRTDEIPDFSAAVILDLTRAHAATAVTERQLHKLKGPFLDSLHQPGRIDLLHRAQRRLMPDV